MNNQYLGRSSSSKNPSLVIPYSAPLRKLKHCPSELHPVQHITMQLNLELGKQQLTIYKKLFNKFFCFEQLKIELCWCHTIQQLNVGSRIFFKGVPGKHFVGTGSPVEILISGLIFDLRYDGGCDPLILPLDPLLQLPCILIGCIFNHITN